MGCGGKFGAGRCEGQGVDGAGQSLQVRYATPNEKGRLGPQRHPKGRDEGSGVGATSAPKFINGLLGVHSAKGRNKVVGFVKVGYHQRW